MVAASGWPAGDVASAAGLEGAEGDIACWLRSVMDRSECGAGRGGSDARACQTHALGAPRACPGHARQNARAA